MEQADKHPTPDYWEVVNKDLVQFAQVSAFSDADALHIARKFMDSQIANLEAITMLIRARRNAISQDSRLPPEILSLVFRFTAAEGPLRTFSGENQGGFCNEVLLKGRAGRDPWGGWLQVLHVCRRWREVALNGRSLWTKITYTTSTRWLEDVLARAGPHPVILHRDLVGQPTMERDVIARHISHIKELRLLCPMEAVWPTCMALRDTPAPLLETFTFSHSNISNSDRAAADVPSYPFRCKMPKLTRLSFHGCKLARDPRIFTNTITCVELSYPAQFNIGLPMQDELLGALRRMPALQELVLKHCLLQFSSPQDLMSPPAVEFNSLRSMVLVDDVHRCAAFICSVRIPIDATVDLTCSVADSSLYGIFNKFVKAGKLFNSARPFLALAIGVSKEDECARIQGWTRLLDNDATTIGDETPSFSLTLGFEENEMYAHFVCLLHVCHRMPLRDLRILSVRLDASQNSGIGSSWDKQSWGLLFKNCLAVKHMIISQSVAPLILGALQEYAVALPGDFQRGGRFEFGHLQTLSIDFIDPHEDNTLDARFPTEMAEALAFAQSDGSMGPISILISEWEDLEIWRKEHKSVYPLSKQRYFREGSFWETFNEVNPIDF